MGMGMLLVRKPPGARARAQPALRVLRQTVRSHVPGRVEVELELVTSLGLSPARQR